MEDGPDDVTSSAIASPKLNNGDIMANFPIDAAKPPTSPIKANGDSALAEDNVDSSDCDNLVIDESVKPTRRKRPRKATKKDVIEGGEFKHTNPYFSESIFELSNFYKEAEESRSGNSAPTPKRAKGNGKRFRGKNGKPKLRDYAQYLGLQPSVQFRCRKCGSTGFQSLQSWNEHFSKCTSITPAPIPPAAHDKTTKLSVKRKVFLCSACGTYYENWNLFLHMREVHKRFICLYCLGMFPHAEKLSLHLVTKHDCRPARFDTVDDFLDAYKRPCFLMCCACQAVFSEQENFFEHGCVDGNPDKSDDTVEPTKITDVREKTDEDRLSNHREAIVEEDGGKAECAPADEQEESDCNSEINMIENENDGDVRDPAAAKVAAEEGERDVRMEDADNSDGGRDEDCGKLNSSDTRDDEVDDDDRDENKLTDVDNNDENESEKSDREEIRKVPKVTLKLPKMSSYNPAEEEEEEYQSEDSDKLTMEIEKESDTEVANDEIRDETCTDAGLKAEPPEEEEEEEVRKEGTVPTAGSDIAIIELELEQPLDKFDIKLLLQKCLRSTISTCLYCNHARKISVNGKQLGLHAIAEHRYSAIVKSITAEELIPESFNARIKECLPELERVYFNLESSAESEGGITFSHIFECFQCRYSTTVHKELYLHNRKLHAKAILLCIMCKTSFYSYCELICHLCPGIYALENDVQFRCCLCVSDDLPSAFRLMVHLRKKHHVCDVCLEMCHDQSRLSNHVWKHKLHHLCYRCGIAYRNKPDITKHLYWKHGTESVLCKKCLQKKWPHVYHFCIPPNVFPCEECSLTFTRSVCLLVHKRLHLEVYPHACTEDGCEEKFVSRKLLSKHEFKHRQPVEEPKKEETEDVKPVVEDVGESADKTEEVDVEVKTEESEEVEEKVTEKPKPKVDVYDLPELNLSESDSSDSDDDDRKTTQPTKKEEKADEEETASILEPRETESAPAEDENPPESEDNTVPVLEHVWDNFNNYQAKIAKLDILTDVGKEEPDDDEDEPKILTDVPEPVTLEDALLDHDYCAPTTDTLKEEEGMPGEQRELGPDHDYCTEKKEVKPVVAESGAPPGRKERSSDSSSNSDSSSCTCGSNCSCSSSSSNSSSSSSDSSESDSSSEEGRRRQQVRRERRRQKKLKKESENAPVDVEAVAPETNAQPPLPAETLIQESDLETTESDTDEDFYDKQPQKLASKLLAEKREKLLQMAGIGPYINGSMIDSRPSTPNLPEVVVNKPKKKSKSKKKKKRKSSKHDSEQRHQNIPRHYSPQIVDAMTAAINTPSPIYNVNSNPVNVVGLMTNSMAASANDNDTNTRASKRRRVPNKFYGYSSDEDGEKMSAVPSALKMRKVEVSPKSPMIVPPLTIKTAPPAQTVEPISIRMTARAGEMRVQPLRLPFQKRTAPKIKPVKPPSLPLPTSQDQESGSESNTSSSEDESSAAPKVKEQPALYCYCRCPYDEVSEMIGCDSDDCAIEWFHFECVGIMVPPKGQWYCPDCRKKKQQRRDMLQHAQMSS